MRNSWPLNAAIFLFVVFLVATLYWLTLDEATDPCAQRQADIGAAVLADEAGDQDGLVNRAIIVKGSAQQKCEPDNN